MNHANTENNYSDLIAIPSELLQEIAKDLTLADWAHLLLTCKALKAVVDSIPDFRFAMLCALSIQANKLAPTSSSSSELLFSNALCADTILINDTRIENVIPRAFQKDRACLPKQLEVQDLTEVVASLDGNDECLTGENVWWLPPTTKSEKEIAEPKAVRRFNSWESCYQEHIKEADMLNSLIEQMLRDVVYPPKEVIEDLCTKIQIICSEEPNVLPLNPPLVVVGDTHGQWANLMEILKLVGEPGDKEFLFLGDYVTRGLHSVPIILLLFALKIRYPHRVHLLKGMAECEGIASVYGLNDECLLHYGDLDVAALLAKAWQSLPLAALIGGEIFAVHGGLSPSIKKINTIQLLDRFQETPLSGAITDLIWSDPDADDKSGWDVSPRGAGYVWGPDISSQFLEDNNLKLILRSHQLQNEGFGWVHDRKVLTIFSAANYCYRIGNRGSIAIIDESLQVTCQTFEGVEERAQ